MKEIVSNNLRDTSIFAKKIAETLHGGDLLLLRGDLGSGKTTFTKEIAKALGITEEVTSPTFTICKVYPFKRGNRDLQLVHIDAYRLRDQRDAETIGLEEMLTGKENVVIVEWPEKLWPEGKPDAREIYFSFVDENTRKMKIVG